MCKLWNCLDNDCYDCKRKAERAKKQPLRRTPLKKKVYKIKRESDKRAKENRLDQKQNKIIREANPYCQMEMEGCTGLTEGVHHMRGRVGSLLTDVTNKIAACNNCNRRAETHPLEAKKLGLSKNRIT